MYVYQNSQMQNSWNIKGVSERVSSGRDKFSKIPHIMNIQSATSFKLLFTSIPSHRQMNAYFCKRRERNCDFLLLKLENNYYKGFETKCLSKKRIV
jgi:hypothetical protein